MERHYVEIFIHLDMPNGETPTIEVDWKPGKKISKAVEEILTAGANNYNFTIKEMDMVDNVAGFALTHGDA